MNQTLPQQLPAQSERFSLLDRLLASRLPEPLGVFMFFAAHIPLALFMTVSPGIATAHAVATFLVGLWYASTRVKPEQVACIVAYLTAAETLWRMTRAMIFWEFGKYALITILFVALVRNGRLRGPLWAFLYFLLLLPSIVLPMTHVDSSEFRNQVSFNLSGPLALAISIWFFSGLEFTHRQMRQIFLAIIGPIIGIVAIALFDTISSESIYFSNNSNFITSGGFGPNQVSSILGLGALLAFLLSFDPKASRGLKMLMCAVLLLLAVQSAMTFSRGGLYAAGGAAILAVFYLIRVPRTRIKVVGGILLLVLATNFILLPQLDAFTGGAITRRFTNTKLTGRDKLIRADLKAWSDNPVFGVGPGQAKIYREEFRADTSAHTEFSRLLAEHGIFGLVASLLLLLMSIQHLRRARPGQGKAFTAAMIAWSFLYMLTAAMRLAAPAFTFGLAAVNIIPDPNTDRTNLPRSHSELTRTRVTREFG